MSVAPAPRPAAVDAETAILSLCRVLMGDGRKDRGLMSHIVNGEQHIERCQRGMWITQGGPRPDGEPCSKRCREAQDALDLAEQWLCANEPVEFQEWLRKRGTPVTVTAPAQLSMLAEVVS